MPDAVPPMQQQPSPTLPDDINSGPVPPMGPSPSPDGTADNEPLPGSDDPGTNPEQSPPRDGFPDHLPGERQQFPRSL
ncbi:MAG: hypothetical protein JWR75_1550 [Devosia sp.]|nr:hypothetical protein [Devosia sp.]